MVAAEIGPEVYRACDVLLQTFSRLYRQAGIKQGSSHSGRRTLAAKVLAPTGDVEATQPGVTFGFTNLRMKTRRW